MMHIFKLIVRALAFALLLGIGCTAWAEPETIAEGDRFNISLGAFFVGSIDATVRLDRNLGAAAIGTSVNWSRDLQGEDSLTVPRIDGFYRFTPRSRIDFSWYNLELTGDTTVGRPIDWGDITIGEGTQVHSYLNNETYKLAYTYSFYRAKEIETSISAGLHMMDLGVGIQVVDKGQAEEAKAFAPLPAFAFRLQYFFNPQWSVFTKSEFFFIDADNTFKGNLSDFILSGEYKPFRYVSFGAGFNRFGLNLQVQNSDFTGAADYVFNGFTLYVTGRY